jgi:hypothetical protein
MKIVILLSVIVLMNSQFVDHDLFDMFLESIYEPKHQVEPTVNLNITDMTLNSVFYILDKNEYTYTIKNQTGLPITIDSKGLSTIIPELAENFKENTELEVTVFKFEKHNAPELDSYITGTMVTFEFGMNITHNGELLVTSSLSGHLKIQLFSDANKLNLFISTLQIDKIDEIGGSLQINGEVFMNNLNMVIKIALNQFKEKMKKFDLLPLINKKLETEFTTFSISQNRGHNQIVLN